MAAAPKPRKKKVAADSALPAAGTWCVYLVQCCDGSLYAGATNRLLMRVAAHDAGKGARYTRSRRPVRLVWWEPAADRSAALSREARLKRLSRVEKLALAAGASGRDLGGRAHLLAAGASRNRGVRRSR